jgi:CheY-like chemotaxis protein
MDKSAVIVDDSEIEGQITKYILLKNSFAENVLIFSSAMAALVHLNKTSVFPDFIFLDVNMPIMDGFDFLNSYIKFPEQKRQGCTVVILSGTQSPEDFIRMQEYREVKAIFRKPLQFERLEELKK